MISFFTGIWPKITAALGVIIGLMFLRGKYQSNKIEKLEHENKTITKENEIASQTAIDKAQVLSDEQDAVLEMTKETLKDDKEITLDDINNL